MRVSGTDIFKHETIRATLVSLHMLLSGHFTVNMEVEVARLVLYSVSVRPSNVVKCPKQGVQIVLVLL